MTEIVISPFDAPEELTRIAAGKLMEARQRVDALGLSSLSGEILRIEQRLVGTSFTLTTTGRAPVFKAHVPD
jgi:hypothetical protein